MRTIRKIARFELSSMFFSPIAWLVLVAFVLLTGLQFFDILDRSLVMALTGNILPSLTRRLFTDAGYQGVWYYLQLNFYLVIPLITMNLLSRELQSGSIKLLLSSPITIFEIVMGKFLAMMVFAFMMILLLFLFVIAGAMTVHALDIKFLISGLIGLYLLICTYSAIGLFMSSLTPYQVVAAVSTLIILGALSYIGSVGQQFAFVRGLTYLLSINGRTQNLIDGLITSRDIIYFLLVIVVFLGLAILRLLSQRESKSLKVVTARYTFLITAALVIGYFSSIPALTTYYDMTAAKTESLTPVSRQIVQKLKAPLTITAYGNILDEGSWYMLPQEGNKERARFEQYQRYLGPITFKHVYFYAHSTNGFLYKDQLNKGLSDKQIAKRTALALGLNFSEVLTAEQVDKEVNLKPENYRSVWQLKAGTRSTLLSFFDDFIRVPTEQEITSAVNGLVADVPRVVFLTGNGERSIQKKGDQDYKLLTTEISFRESLINQGFDVQKISLAQSDVPKNIAALVIADPRSAFTASELKKLQDYIGGGGNLVIAGEPGKQDFLNPLTAPLGVNFLQGEVQERSHDFAPDFVLSAYNKQTFKLLDKDSSFLNNDGLIATESVAALSYNTGGLFYKIPILVTDPEVSWLTPAVRDTSSTDHPYQPERNDQKASFTTALALTRTINRNEQRIMILGDADLFNNAELVRQSPQTDNGPFSTQVFKWMTYGKYPVSTNRPAERDTKFLVNQKDTVSYKIILLGVIPGLLTLLAVFFLMRRQKR